MNTENVIYCMFHRDNHVSLVCLQYQCVKNSLMCQSCIEERHEGHPYISLSKMKNTMVKFKSRKRELTKENLDKARRIKGLFQDSYDCFQQLLAKMKRLSEFMDTIEQSLLFNSDELKVVTDVIKSIEEGNETEVVHKKFDIMFRNCQIQWKNQTELMVHSFQEQKNTFSGSLRGQVDIVFREFESFLAKMQQLEKKYRQFSKPKNEVTEEQRNIEFGKQQLTPFYMNQLKLQQHHQKNNQPVNVNIGGQPQNNAYMPRNKHGTIEDEQNYSMNIIERQMNLPSVEPSGPRKLVFKLYSYLIFYLAIICDAFVPEPVLGGVVLKKVESGELKMPIRCLFCRQVRIKSFVEFYFRFELTTRFGKLCLFRVQDVNNNQIDIYAHEMCLLWTNTVVVDYETRRVDVASVTQAAQEATQTICSYCQLTGASTRCAEDECDVAFHFNCLKQMKLVGIRLDNEHRYRFYCDQHQHLVRAEETSDWFMSRSQVQTVLETLQENRPQQQDTSMMEPPKPPKKPPKYSIKK